MEIRLRTRSKIHDRMQWLYEPSKRFKDGAPFAFCFAVKGSSPFLTFYNYKIFNSFIFMAK